ncbi:helix-turn-helix domain-containing protein [Desulfurispirillum indicum]|uniref:Peptidase S24/S26A/S26B, conserved region n=1 Tax=Desulfurispirillum indicum (strain ATCC BAA-1389 / DSM 22839 / S5) TaxID=653733 RepID=E6W350_DESIS|nr:LexA family transcriptional regulator [Desulfurispirillum indicum]ADU65711.1 Peptidase S24/S26A/S26B, conserved region [Desulfurispirillum indicum S5]UCZ57453.1 helix-turn-helix domain-containing protein [Desulfurispirillum indicum]
MDSFSKVWERIQRVTGWKTQAELASALDIRQASVSGAKQRGSMPLEWIYTIARKYNTSMDWLLNGEDVSPGFSGENSQQHISLPKYSVVHAQSPEKCDASKLQASHLTFCQDWLQTMGLDKEALILVEVCGDSMEPTIYAGDILLVDQRFQKVGNDGIYILRLHGELVVKRVQRLIDGSLRIMSDNKAYMDQTISAELSEQVCVVGFVVWRASQTLRL